MTVAWRMTMALAPKRRWLRFSLRTLFLVLTVVGCWLGYELNWIRLRHAALATGIVETEPFPRFFTSQATAAPGHLWLFGETGYPDLWIQLSEDDPTQAEEELVAALQELFPESAIEYYWAEVEPPPKPHRPPRHPWSDYDGFKL